MTRIAEVLEGLADGPLPFGFSAFDGSSAGPSDAPFHVHLANERGLRFVATSPGGLGLARAYVAGDLQVEGVPGGDPYAVLRAAADGLRLRRPGPVEAVRIARGLGLGGLRPPAPPPEEHLSRARRLTEGLRHSRRRDAEAISHHYDVSNDFYARVLGPSMTYTCACFPTPQSSLEQAQEHKYALVAGKLGLRPGMRLLDVGCGWGGMVLHAARRGIRALGVTLSREQAEWARAQIEAEGLAGLAEVRHADYRDVTEGGFDAVSSIGLTEHIGVANYRAYFSFLQGRLRDGGRLLNHSITRPTNSARPRAGGFIDRYVFPDGELTGSGRIITEMQDVGLEVRHEENLREHYAMTLREWCANLTRHWDECVADVGIGTARVWGLYMAGSRLAFERNEIQLHQVLAVRPGPDGVADFPLRPDWIP
ncbi:class I SAM-dependent methyltransferase [Oerskovia turbata]